MSAGLWSFPASSLLLFTPLPSPPCLPTPSPFFYSQAWGQLGSFSPWPWLFMLQILSRALGPTPRCSLSGPPVPSALTLTWRLVPRAQCLLPCLPWRRFRWSYNVLTSGRGSMILERRWSSPKQAGKDVLLSDQTQRHYINGPCYSHSHWPVIESAKLKHLELLLLQLDLLMWFLPCLLSQTTFSILWHISSSNSWYIIEKC